MRNGKDMCIMILLFIYYEIEVNLVVENHPLYLLHLFLVMIVLIYHIDLVYIILYIKIDYSEMPIPQNRPLRMNPSLPKRSRNTIGKSNK